MTHRHGLTGRILALTLAMVMIATSLPQTAMTAYAAEETVDVEAADAAGVVTEAASDEDVDQDTPENEQESDKVIPPAEEGNTPDEETVTTEPPQDEIDTTDLEEVFEEMERPVEKRGITRVVIEDLQDVRATVRISVTDYAKENTCHLSVFYQKQAAEGEATGPLTTISGITTDSAVTYLTGLAAESVYEYTVYLTEETVDDGDLKTGGKIYDSFGGTFKTKSFKPLKSVSQEVGINKVNLRPEQVEFDWKYTGPVQYFVRICEDKEGAVWSGWSSFVKNYTNGAENGDSINKSQCYRNVSLDPETAYKFEMAAGKPTDSGDAAVKVNKIEGTFTTLKDVKLGEMKDPLAGIHAVKFTVPFVAGGAGETTYAYAFLSEKGKNEFTFTGSGSSDKASGEIEITVSGVKANEEYDYVVVLNRTSVDDYSESAAYSDKKAGVTKTQEDKRTLKDLKVTAVRSRSADVSVSYDGGTDGVDTTFVVVYYREKTEDENAVFSRRGVSGDYSYGYAWSKKKSDTFEFRLRSLEEGKEYQYVAVIVEIVDGTVGPSGYDPKDKDKYIVTEIKELKTENDGRALDGDPKAAATYTKASIDVSFKGNAEKDATYAGIYYRVSGSTDPYRYQCEYSSEAADTVRVNLTGLSGPGTAYEYIVVLQTSSSQLADDKLALNPKEEATAKAAREAGMLDKLSGQTFSTKADMRKVITPVYDLAYSMAEVSSGYTGSYEGELTTHFYLFLLDPATNKYVREYHNWSANENMEFEHWITDLNAGTEYTGVIVLSDSDAITTWPLESGSGISVIDQAEVRFTTTADERALTAVVDAGYKSIKVVERYSGNTSGKPFILSFYYRKSEPAGGSYRKGESASVESAGEGWRSAVVGAPTIELESGTSYDYAVIFSEAELGEELTENAVNDLKAKNEKWVVTGSCTLKKADFHVDVNYDQTASSTGHDVFTVALASDTQPENYDDSIEAEVTVYREADAGKKSVSLGSTTLRNSAGYSGKLVSDNLIADTKYVVSGVDLTFREFDKNLTIPAVPKTGDTFGNFTTNAAALTVTDLSSQKLYLNLNNSYGGMQYITLVAEPQYARKLVTCVVADGAATDVASIDYYRNSNNVGEVGIFVTPLKAGTTTFNVISSEDAEKKALATFEVNVADYILAEAPAEGGTPVANNSYTIAKGSSTKTLGIYDRTNSYAPVTSVSLEAGNHVAAWENNALKGINFGTNEAIVLRAGDYTVDAFVTVEVPTTGFVVTDLKTADPAYAAIITGNTSQTALSATVAAGKRYMIEGYMTPMNQVLSEVTKKEDLLQFKVDDAGAAKGVTVTADGEILTAASSASYKATVTVSAKVTGDHAWEQTAVITLDVKPIPEIPAAMGYVLTDVASKLGDVDLGGRYAGWNWDDAAATPLFNQYVRSGAYDDTIREFTASHDGSGDKYPLSGQKVSLHVCTMTEMNVSMRNRTISEDVINNVVELKDGKAEVGFSMRTSVRHMGVGFFENSPANYNMLMDQSQYKYTFECTDKKAQLSINRESAFVDSVIFTKAGTYNFVARVLSKDEKKTIFSAKYKINVLEAEQIRSIKLKTATYLDGTTDVYGKISNAGGNGTSTIPEYAVERAEAAEKGLILTVETFGYSARPITAAKLVWKSSDTRVATVTADKVNTRIVKIKPGKEQGHAMITATAKDAMGKTYNFRYQYRNMAPRVDKKAVKVNLAYDNSPAGQKFAYEKYGSGLEIVPVYGNSIDDVMLYNRTASASSWESETARTLSADFFIALYDTKGNAKQCVVQSYETANTGKYNLWLVVKAGGVEYAYPFTVTAAVKKPAVTIKASKKVNMFYINDSGRVKVTLSADVNDPALPPILAQWKDDSTTTYGFSMGTVSVQKTSGKSCYFTYPLYSYNVRVNKGRLVDAGVDKGTVTVTLQGVRKKYGGVAEKQIKLPWTYKKPVLVSQSASSTIVKEAGEFGNSFYVYNKTDKRHVQYAADTSLYNATGIESLTERTDVTFENDPSGCDYVRYTYNGSRKSEKIAVKLYSPAKWREPLIVTHTVRDVAPKAALNVAAITTNSTLDDLFLGMEKEYDNTELKYFYNPDLYIYMKGSNYIINLSDLKIEGIGNTAQELVDKNFIVVGKNDYSGYEDEKNTNKAYIGFRQNALASYGGGLKKGTYRFKLTPSYTKADGTLQALNPVTLSIKVVDQGMKAKTSAKGSLDIARASYIGYKESNAGSKRSYAHQNVVKVNTKFTNLPYGVDFDDITLELKGQYADCFELYKYDGNWFIGFSGFTTDNPVDDKFRYYGVSSYNKRLKAGITIPLHIEYKINVLATDDDGTPAYRAISIGDGGTFKVKIKQSKPRVTIKSGNNQVLYQAGRSSSDQVVRYVEFSVPYGCKIRTLSGYQNHVSVDISSTTTGGGARAEIRVYDWDAVSASAAGKTVSIPVHVTMDGADGISQDVTVTVKVKVKR